MRYTLRLVTSCILRKEEEEQQQQRREAKNRFEYMYINETQLKHIHLSSSH